MTPKQFEAIRQHGEALLRIFPSATERDPVKLCKKLRRIENKAHAHAVRLCNEDVPEDEDERVSARLYRNVCRLLGSERPFLNRDPRGYALKVSLRSELRVCHDCARRSVFPSGPTWYGTRDGGPGKCHRCGGEGLRVESYQPEALHQDMGGYGIIAPEIGPDGR